MANSVLTSRYGNYVPYTAYNLKILLENELQKYSPLNRYFLSKSYFKDDGIQNYLIFQLMSRYLKFVIVKILAHGDLKDYQTKKLRL